MTETPENGYSPPLPPYGYRRHSLVAPLLCVVWIYLVTGNFSGSFVDGIVVSITALFAVVWALLWMIRFACYRRRVSLGKQQFNRSWRHWCVEPLIFLLMALLASSGCLTSWRLRLSAQALEQYAQDLIHHRASPITSAKDARRIGLYWVTGSEQIGTNQVYLATEPTMFGGDAGFAYVSEGVPLPANKLSHTEHLYGNWWLRDRPKTMVEAMADDEKRLVPHLVLRWLSSLSK